MNSVVGFGSFGDHKPSSSTIHLWREAAKKAKYKKNQNLRNSFDQAVGNFYVATRDALEKKKLNGVAS